MDGRRSTISLSGLQVLVLTVLLQMSAAGQSTETTINGVYRGTLAGQEIVLEIGAVDPHRNDHTCTPAPASTNTGWTSVCFNNGDEPDQPIEGRYFYRQKGVATLVEGTILVDGNLRIQEYQNGKPSSLEWQLRFSQDKAIGFVCECDVRRQDRQPSPKSEISLFRVSRGFDPVFDTADPDDNTPDQAYYDLLLDFPLRTSTEIRISKEIAYIMQTDDRFKVSLPRLTHFPDLQIMHRVNQDLTRKLDRARLDAAFCRQGIGFTGGEWEEEQRVTLFNATILSIMRETNYSCGGPHPDASADPIVYDMRTGQELDLKNLFPVQTDNAVLKDGVVPLGPAHSLLLKLYHRHYVKPAKECHKSDAGSDTTLKMYFDKMGLVLIPELEHARAGCAFSATIPYEELRPLVRKNSVLPLISSD